MAIYIMATRSGGEPERTGRFAAGPSEGVARKIRQDCPGVEWTASYVTAGAADRVVVFTAPDLATAELVADLVADDTGASTALWPGVPWDRFLGLVRYVRAEDYDNSAWQPALRGTGAH